MTTINLYQNKQENERQASSRGVSNGFFFSMGILVVTLLVLFGLKFYNPILERENNALSATVSDENSKLAGLKNLEQVVDMQARISEIKKNLQIKNGEVSRTEMMKILDKLSLDMNKGIVISSYDYADDRVTVNFSASNFTDASKQIFNFKKSEYFADANLLKISRGENSVLFEVEMKIKG